MAKKKTQKSYLPLILIAASVLLALVSVIMIFVASIGVVDSDTTYTGLQLVFGYKEDIIILGETQIFGFSFMALLPYIFVLGGIVLAVLSALGKLGKLFSFVACGLLIAAGVLFFLSPSFVVMSEDAASLSQFIGLEYKLAAGAIIAGIFSILSGVSIGARMLLK